MVNNMRFDDIIYTEKIQNGWQESNPEKINAGIIRFKLEMNIDQICPLLRFWILSILESGKESLFSLYSIC